MCVCVLSVPHSCIPHNPNMRGTCVRAWDMRVLFHACEGPFLAHLIGPASPRLASSVKLQPVCVRIGHAYLFT